MTLLINNTTNDCKYTDFRRSECQYIKHRYIVGQIAAVNKLNVMVASTQTAKCTDIQSNGRRYDDSKYAERQ